MPKGDNEQTRRADTLGGLFCFFWPSLGRVRRYRVRLVVVQRPDLALAAYRLGVELVVVIVLAFLGVVRSLRRSSAAACVLGLRGFL